MRRTTVALASLLVSTLVLADPTASQSVDLRDAGALEKLRESNPAHHQQITRIIQALDERPDRVASRWLESNFAARDVDLSRLLIRTSYPPKQLLQFTLDDTRYTMHVIRTDLNARVRPVR